MTPGSKEVGDWGRARVGVGKGSSVVILGIHNSSKPPKRQCRQYNMRQAQTKVVDLTAEEDLCGMGFCSHAFLLNPNKTGLFYREQITLKCCPLISKDNRTTYNIWPHAFPDAMPHLPFFMLEADRPQIVRREKEYLEAHLSRVRNQEDSQKEMLVPHPGKSKSTCFVCKSYYTDYLKHIESKKHRKKINSSKMEPAIKELVTVVSKSNEIEFKEEASTTCNEDSSRALPIKEKTVNKALKRQLKEAKGAERFKAQSFDEGEQMREIQIKVEESGLRGEDLRINLGNLISMHSFRVSDYLV